MLDGPAVHPRLCGGVSTARVFSHWVPVHPPRAGEQPIRDANMISHEEMMPFAGGRRQAGDRPSQGCAKVTKLTEMVLFGNGVITFGRSRSPVLWGAGDMPAFLGFDVESVVASAIRLRRA